MHTDSAPAPVLTSRAANIAFAWFAAILMIALAVAMVFNWFSAYLYLFGDAPPVTRTEIITYRLEMATTLCVTVGAIVHAATRLRWLAIVCQSLVGSLAVTVGVIACVPSPWSS